MFTDHRSRKILLLAHCLLNQNAKLDRCAHHPGVFTELMALILRSGVGVLQLPCPELLYLGLDRQTDRAQNQTIAAEDTRIAQRMQAGPGRALCMELVQPVLFQIQQYQKEGFQVVGLVGINGSPTCGVETNWAENVEPPGPGVFTRVLQEALNHERIMIPMVGVKTYQPDQAVMAVKEILHLN